MMMLEEEKKEKIIKKGLVSSSEINLQSTSQGSQPITFYTLGKCRFT